MTELPALSEIQSSPSGPTSPLAHTLDILFEHSPILTIKLESQLHDILKSSGTPASYAQLIDVALAEIAKWDVAAQSEFISGHPRIGESKNLSALSESEQGGRSGVQPTPPEILARLAHLNALYEVKYPGRRYITFVNGRTRAVIAEEMEDVLGIPRSLSPNEPEGSGIVPVDPESKKWKEELDRAVYDVGRIAKSRLAALGVN